MVTHEQSIRRAVEILRGGGLVAFPTETVYGLGGDATNPAAVERIFAAKGRPATNPLIVHVTDAGVARRFAADWPAAADALTNAFWPGPLTLVLPKRQDGVVPQATAGLPSVALRSPDHRLALELLRAFDGPVAAPSANRSTHVSPTTARHVRDELGAKVEMVLDGGPCRVGIESTVLDLTAPEPTILRPGGITREQIERAIGPVRAFTGSMHAARPAASPGQQEVHYAPQTPAFRFELDERDAATAWLRTRSGFRVQGSELRAPGEIALLLLFDSPAIGPLDRPARIVVMPNSPEAYAAALYGTLREWDAGGLEAILVEMPPNEPTWIAVRDRLRRATRPI